MNEPIITVIGNLVADPELRTSQSGNSWVTFRIASTPRQRDRNTGQWVDGETLWLGCTAFGETAENIANSLTKGTRVIAQGRLTQRSYTDSQEQQRTSLDLQIDAIGPELRFATVQVAKVAARGQGGFGGQQAQPVWGNAGNSGVSDPWANSNQQQNSWANAENGGAQGAVPQDPWGAQGTF